MHFFAAYNIKTQDPVSLKNVIPSQSSFTFDKILIHYVCRRTLVLA